MRKIGKISSHKERTEFQNYLYYHKIESHCYENNEEIWVLHDTEREEAKALLDFFQKNFQQKNDSTQKIRQEILAQSEEGSKLKKANLKQKDKKEKRSKHIDARTFIRKNSQILPGTGFIIALSVLIFLIGTGSFKGPLYSLLLISKFPVNNPYGISPLYEVIQQFEVWRVISPIFLHHDFFHIIFNMLWLYQIGSIIEKKEGLLFYLLLIFIVGSFSALSHYFIVGPHFGGMSGVIYGLVAYLWSFKKVTPFAYPSVDEGIFRFFMFWYLICFIMTFFGIPIANTVHGTGALSGSLLGVIRAYQKGEGKVSLKRFLSPKNLQAYFIIVLLCIASFFIDRI